MLVVGVHTVLHSLLDDSETQYLLAGRPKFRVCLQQRPDQGAEVLRVLRRQPLVDASGDLFKEPLHVFCPEGRLRSNGFIKDAAKGPDI